MNKQEQLKFIAEKFKEIDSTELERIVKAIYGHPHDMGRPAKLNPALVGCRLRSKVVEIAKSREAVNRRIVGRTSEQGFAAIRRNAPTWVH
jgi:hypothetical protein